MSNLVCVTGACGFIGRYVCQCIKDQGGSVLAVDMADGGDIACDIHDHEAVTDIMHIHRPTHLLHLAWCAGQGYAESPANVGWVESSMHLIKAFYNNAGHRFMGVGSCFEYAPTTSPCHELNTPTVPITLYGKAKLALGAYLQAYAVANCHSWAWCRPFYITGPGEGHHRLVPAACAALASGQSFISSAPNTVLDYMDVRDVAAALVRTLFSDYCGTVNVGTGTGIKVCDLLQKIHALVDHRGELRYAEEDTPMSIVADTRSLRKNIGFTPQHTLDGTVATMLAEGRYES